MNKFAFSFLLVLMGLLSCSGRALASGPFTLPFENEHSISAFYDLDARYGWISDYLHSEPWYDPDGENWQYGYAYDAHSGTDYSLSSGTEVWAAASGTVIATLDGQVNTYDSETDTCSYPQTGNKINIQHDDNYETRYYHLLSGGLQVSATSTVQRGDYIADSGNTGCSTGDHLHFETRQNDVALDPYSNNLWTSDPPVFYRTYAEQITKDTGSYISNNGYLTLWQSLGSGFSISNKPLSMEISLKGNVVNRDIRIYTCLVSDLASCINNLGGASMQYFISSNTISTTGSQASYVVNFNNVSITPDRYVFFRLPWISNYNSWITGYGSTNSDSYENGQCIKYTANDWNQSACPNSVSDLNFHIYYTTSSNPL